MNVLWQKVDSLNWRVKFVDNERGGYLSFGTSIWCRSHYYDVHISIQKESINLKVIGNHLSMFYGIHGFPWI